MKFLVVVLSSLMLVACGGGQDSGFPLEVSGSAPPKAMKADIVPMTLTSSAFVDNGVIPDQFVYSYASQCTGSNWSPPLNIGNVPASTAGLAVVVQDLDAANLVHWKAWNIPATTAALAANASTNATFSQSYNGLGSLGYGGPCPPSTSAHRYVFTLYALSKTFSSEPTLSDLGANALATAMLTGRRSSTDRLAWNTTPGASFAGNGWYWDDKAGGTGMAFEAQGSSAFAGLFMYDAAGKAIWYVATGTFSIAATGYQFTGDLRQYAGGQALGGAWKMPTSVSVGTLNIAFTGNGNTTRAVVSLPGGRQWSTVRFNFNGLDAVNSGAQPESGWFWNATEGGRGYAIEVQNGQMFMAMFHYAADGSPTWQVVQNNMDSSGNITGADFRKYANGQTLTSAYVSPAAPVADGTVSTSFGNPCGGALTINALPSIQLQRYGFADLTNGAECRVRAAANANGTPWANAGMSQSVTAGSTVTLDGSASSDPNGDPLTYAWTLTSKPAGSAAALSSATSVRPTFTADLAGTYVASLVVNDGKVNSTTVTVSVTVGPTATAATTTAPTTSTTITAAATTTTARTTSTTAAVAVGTTTTTQTTSTAWVQPVANAGVSQSVTAGSSVTLNGSASSDPNGYSLTYAWTLSSKPAGSAAALSSATSVRPTFTADLAGTYVASLTVNNGWVGSSPVTVNITAGVANIAPVANPGVSQSVTAGSTVTLNGSASSDPNGDPLTYAWTLTSKPAGSAAALSSATAVRPTFTADLAGTYVASLTVNDGKVNSTTVTVNITAGVANIAPVANAGVSQSVTYLGESVTLDGSASSDANGDPLTYAWTLRSFPSIFAPTISGAKTVRPAFTPLDAGAYVFSLVVNDGRVSSTASTVTVTVGNGVSPTPTGSGLVLENVLNFWTLDEATLTKRVDFSCGVGLSAIDRRPDGVIVGTETSQLYEINPISGVCSARGKLPEWIRAVAVSASGQVFGMSTYQASRPDGSGVAHRLHKLSSEGASQSYTFLSGASTYVNAIAFGPDGQLYGLGITYGGGWSIVRINPDTGVTTVAFAMPVAPTLGDIDIDSSGVLRTMIDGSLYKFNITTGALLSSTRVPNFPLGNSFAPVVYVP